MSLLAERERLAAKLAHTPPRSAAYIVTQAKLAAVVHAILERGRG